MPNADRRPALTAYTRTLSLLWQSSPLLTLGLAISILVGAAVPMANFVVVLYLVNAITAAVGHAAWWRHVLPWLAALVALRLASAAAQQMRGPLETGLRENLEVWINSGLIRRAAGADLADLQSRPFQDALARARGVSGLDLVNILGQLVQSAQHLFAALSLSAVLWRYGPAIPLLPLLGGLASWLRDERFAADLYESDRAQTRLRRIRDGLAGLLTDRIAAKEVRLYQAAPLWLQGWQQLWLQIVMERRGIERRRIAASAALDLFRGLLYGGALVLLVRSALQGGMSLGAYVAGATALIQLEGTWSWAANHFGYLTGAMRRMRGDFFGFLDADTSPLGDPGVDEGLPPDRGIVLDRVTFTYPGQETPALDGVSLTIPPGQRIGVVGPNGAGKSTLARILLGLYVPSAGSVSVGGAPLEGARRRAWWRRCSGVFQDFIRYGLTARENVAFGDLSHPERTEAAAESGDASAVIAELPGGYDTTLGPTFGGRDLSGGQWQRLATARGFMADAGLIVLDEPAAALDPLAELGVYERFGALTAGRTAVLISHRLASARQCDRIIVLDAGRVVEDGTHADLLTKGGVYASLFTAQAQWYADPEGNT